jgi:proline racemase
VRFESAVELLQVHCQGELGKVIVGGVPPIPGATVLEQMNHLNAGHDAIRRFVTLEPRGMAAMSVNLLVEPTRPDADAGFIVLQADRAHPMSGSNTICVVTALLESGRVVMHEPETVVRLDTAAGLVVARAQCRDGRVESVSFDNVPAWVHTLDAPVDTPRWGTIGVDVVFGGVFYAQVDVEQIGLTIEPSNARELAELGLELRTLIAEQISVEHPEIPGLDHIAYVMWRSQDDDGALRTCTTLPPGRVDRSPCGTGSSANLAVEHARGRLAVGDRRVSRSIIDGEFLAEAIGTTEVGGRTAVLPRITGRAWIYGTEQLRLDPDDPFPLGFVLSDTWGTALDGIG